MELSMPTVNMFEAKSTLSRLVEAVETGQESEIVIARNGRPAARLVPIGVTPPTANRIGVASGRFTLPESIDEHNDEVARQFIGPGGAR
jgi:prevent-host-death family protein